MAQHRLLFVDDEQNILKSLERLFLCEDYEIVTATSGEQALERLNNGEVSLVISDQKMPGIRGVELLGRIKDVSPDTIGILLTGHADMRVAIEAINSGVVYKYIEKPWDDEQCKLAIKRALEQYDLIQKNRRLTGIIQEQNEELKYLNENLQVKISEKTEEILQKNVRLKKNFIDTTRVFAGLVEMRDEYVGGHSKRVAVSSKELAKRYRLSEEENFDVEVAALLHDIGKIGLKDAALIASNMGLYDKGNKKVQEQHAVMGQMSLLGIDGLKKVAEMIRHHHENYDGTGVPDRLKGEEIPLGSRIIAVVDTFDGLRFRRGAKKSFPEDVVHSSMRKLAGTKLDPSVVEEFLGFLEDLRVRGTNVKKNTMRIHARALEENMVLARDIITDSNMLLIARDEKIKRSYLQKIRYYVERGLVQDYFYVYPPEKTKEPTRVLSSRR
ncbi:MAG: response regulator [Candidatus Abyssubacteria bacterium]|nr:response regulator [Candidatus Abyssubacteria bacterium]